MFAPLGLAQRNAPIVPIGLLRSNRDASRSNARWATSCRTDLSAGAAVGGPVSSPSFRLIPRQRPAGSPSTRPGGHTRWPWSHQRPIAPPLRPASAVEPDSRGPVPGLSAPYLGMPIAIGHHQGSDAMSRDHKRVVANALPATLTDCGCVERALKPGIWRRAAHPRAGVLTSARKRRCCGSRRRHQADSSRG